MVKTAENQFKIVRFAQRKGANNFFDDLKVAVEGYFQQEGVDKRANTAMVVKTFAMMAIYLVPFLILVSGLTASSLLLFWGCWVMMAVGMVGIGTSVMHDSNHGAYTGNKRLGNILGGAIHMIGGYDRTWKIQHNVLHHTYTNLDGLDHDIDAGIVLRFSKHAPKRSFHQYQHLYAWFLYGLLTVNWCTLKDYKALVEYEKNGLLRKTRMSLRDAIIELTAIRLVYFALFLILPALYSGYSFGTVLAGFAVMHFLAGLALSSIFQLAHVMEECEFPAPTADQKIENTWAVHQLKNTVNFAPNNRLLSWFIGGLNFQIEHHLFPSICHVHYKKLSPVVEKVARQHGLNYYVYPTFRRALRMHAEMLRSLGK